MLPCHSRPNPFVSKSLTDNGDLPVPRRVEKVSIRLRISKEGQSKVSCGPFILSNTLLDDADSTTIELRRLTASKLQINLRLNNRLRPNRAVLDEGRVRRDGRSRNGANAHHRRARWVTCESRGRRD